MTTTRFAQWATFAMMNVTMFVFAVWPLETIVWAEWSVAILSLVCLTAITVDEIRPGHFWITHFGYLLTGSVAMYTALAFALTTEMPADVATPIVMMLSTFAVGGLSTHVTGAIRQEEK